MVGAGSVGFVMNESEDESKRARSLERLAWWLDNAIAIPGTRFRIGFDALIGLVPGIGDLVGAGLSTYIVVAAAKRGLPASVLARMALNIAVEFVVGAIPFVGDVFDAYWKANQRNVELIERYAAVPRRTRVRSRLVVGIWIAAGLVIVALAAAIAIAVLRWVWQQLG